MKLAVYADSKGRIAGLAVCQVIFHNDRNGPREISIRAEPLYEKTSDVAHHEAETYKTHIIELPAHLANKPHYELVQVLHDIHASMVLDLTQSVPCLCKSVDVHERADATHKQSGTRPS
jgi:hypothetical protein